METTTDRDAIPELDEQELIKLNETRLGRIGSSVVTAISVIGAGILTYLGLNEDTITDTNPSLVLLAAGVLLAVGLLSWAIVAAADVRARGEVTAANLMLRQRAPLTVAAPGADGEPGTDAGLWVQVANRGTEPHLVVGAQKTKPKSDESTFALADADGYVDNYLVSRKDEDPVWVTADQIVAWEIKTADEGGS